MNNKIYLNLDIFACVCKMFAHTSGYICSVIKTNRLLTTKNITAMKTLNDSIVITPHVINTINSLPEEERVAVASAFISEMIMGVNPEDGLTPLQTMLYSVIRFYIQQDSVKYKLSHVQAQMAV